MPISKKNLLNAKATEVGLGDISLPLWEACNIKHGEDSPSKVEELYVKMMTSLIKFYQQGAPAQRVELPCVKIIKAFEIINPMVGRLYGMKSQRDSADRLIKQFGENELLGIIKVLEQTNAMPFAPVITTPCQLEMKIGQLMAFIKTSEIKQKGTQKSIGVAF